MFQVGRNHPEKNIQAPTKSGAGLDKGIDAPVC